MEKVTSRKGVADTPEAWIYYKESGHGTPILMLHGNAQTHLVFSYYEKQLSRKYRVVLMDSRAHGHSQIKPFCARKEFTTADMARDAAALLDSLHIDACILLGFSDGANIALEFASLFPSRTIAVIAVSGNSAPDGLLLPVRLFFRAKYRICRAAANQRLPIFHRPFPGSFFRHRQQLTALLCHSPQITEEQLQAIQAPVLLIAGTRDLVKVSHSRYMARQIPRAQLLLVKGGTHTSMFVHKSFYLRVIRHFLQTI